MHSVSEKEVNFILNDIKARGVVLEDLQNNLLDHICCMVENEMPEGENFYKFYEHILPQFFKHELKELQVEVDILLKFKNYYAMKNTVKYSGIISSLLILIGAILKTLHLPGAAALLVLGGVIFGFLFLPLMVILKFMDEQNKIDKWVHSIGFLLALGVFMGIMFKVMHWQGAHILFRSSLTIFIFVFVPVYFFTRIRRPELRFNTIVNASLMMATGGMLYAMINLGYANKVIEQDHNHSVDSSSITQPPIETPNLTSGYLFPNIFNLYQY